MPGEVAGADSAAALACAPAAFAVEVSVLQGSGAVGFIAAAFAAAVSELRPWLEAPG
jgi:hypothetical protein